MGTFQIWVIPSAGWKHTDGTDEDNKENLKERQMIDVADERKLQSKKITKVSCIQM